MEVGEPVSLDPEASLVVHLTLLKKEKENRHMREAKKEIQWCLRAL